MRVDELPLAHHRGGLVRNATWGSWVYFEIREEAVLSRDAGEHLGLEPFLLSNVERSEGWGNKDAWMSVE